MKPHADLGCWTSKPSCHIRSAHIHTSQSVRHASFQAGFRFPSLSCLQCAAGEIFIKYRHFVSARLGSAKDPAWVGDSWDILHRWEPISRDRNPDEPSPLSDTTVEQLKACVAQGHSYNLAHFCPSSVPQEGLSLHWLSRCHVALTYVPHHTHVPCGWGKRLHHRAGCLSAHEAATSSP